ncbi:MAG: geranylgeranylglycerol-phosphate geranylgeranyltransferase [Methanospirillum sp.]
MLPGYLAILRPTNAVVSGLVALLAFLIAGGAPGPVMAGLFLAVVFITGAGNTINDYYDAAIDAVNRPERPIPSGRVSARGAARYAALLFLAGVLAAVPAGPVPALIAAVNAVLLWLYAARLKRVALVGHLAVAYLAASTFIFGGAAAGISGLEEILPLALITALGTVARELLKAAEDVEGDREGGARTFPVRYGVRPTVRLALLFAIAGVAASALPYAAWGAPYLALIAPADLLILGGALRAVRCATGDCVRDGRATTLLKAGMYLALAAFAAAALLAA